MDSADICKVIQKHSNAHTLVQHTLTQKELIQTVAKQFKRKKKKTICKHSGMGWKDHCNCP